MSAVAVAVVGAAVIGGVVASNNANKAASAQSDAASSANATQLYMYNNNVALNKPWVDSGTAALGQLNSEMPDLTRKFTAADFQQDPGYQFDLQQGQQAMQRSAAAKGMLNSVGTQQNLNNYSMGMASNEYGNAYNRFVQSQQQRYNMLAGLAGNGQTAVGQISANGAQVANNVSNNTMASGNAQAANYIAQGNAVNGTIQNGLNGYMNYSTMQTLMNNQAQNGGSTNFTMPAMGSGYNSAPVSNYNTALGTYDF